MTSMAKKPIADRVDRFSMKKIIYRCPNCNTSFATLGDKIHFCYNCGTKIDWNVVICLTKPFNLTYEEEQKFIDEINQYNSTLPTK